MALAASRFRRIRRDVCRWSCGVAPHLCSGANSKSDSWIASRRLADSCILGFKHSVSRVTRLGLQWSVDASIFEHVGGVGSVFGDAVAWLAAGSSSGRHMECACYFRGDLGTIATTGSDPRPEKSTHFA